MKGVDRLRAKLLAVAPACRQAAEEAVRQGAEDAARAAAALAPVDTGRLRGSIAARASGLSAEVSADCDYAAAVELGGQHRPARPFLLPAAQASAADFFETARDRANAGIHGIG